jgi:hypothetical protein
VGIPALNVTSSNGGGAVQLRSDHAAGDVQLMAGRHIDMLALSGSIEIKTQTGGQELVVNAQSGTLSLSGDTNASLTSSGNVTLTGTTGVTLNGVNAMDINGHIVTIDGGTGLGAALNIGGTNRAATQIDALALGLDSTAAITIAADDDSSMSVAGDGVSLTLAAQGGLGARLIVSSAGTGTDAIKITASAGGTEIVSMAGASLLQGVGATLASTGVGGTASMVSASDIVLQSATPITPITMKGWVQQDYTASAGMGVSVKVRTSGGSASKVGEVFAFVDDGAPGVGTEAKAISAADGEAPGVCGSFLEAVAAGAVSAASTVQGAVVQLAFDGSGMPAGSDVGAPVYLSATTGKASKAATQVSGQHVIRLGFAMEAGTGRVMWAPQYIAKRP